MTNCARSKWFFRNRKIRRERVLRKMENMRAAKKRKRMANPVEREPKLVPFYPFEFGIREKTTGESAWTDFKSVRDAARRLSSLKRYRY